MLGSVARSSQKAVLFQKGLLCGAQEKWPECPTDLETTLITRPVKYGDKCTSKEAQGKLFIPCTNVENILHSSSSIQGI